MLIHLLWPAKLSMALLMPTRRTMSSWSGTGRIAGREGAPWWKGNVDVLACIGSGALSQFGERTFRPKGRVNELGQDDQGLVGLEAVDNLQRHHPTNGDRHHLTHACDEDLSRLALC